MNWFFKKRKREYIAVITRHSECEPLQNEVVLCREFGSIVEAKNEIRRAIRNLIIGYIPIGLDADESNKCENNLVKSIHFESHNEVLHGENALDAISETLIPSSRFMSVKEREEYYDNFTCAQLSFFMFDESMLRTVFGVFLREK